MHLKPHAQTNNKFLHVSALGSLRKHWSLSRYQFYHKLSTLLRQRKLKGSNFTNCKTITLTWSILVWCALRARIWRLVCNLKSYLIHEPLFFALDGCIYFLLDLSCLQPTQCVGYTIVLTSAVHNNHITASKEIRLTHQMTFLGHTCFWELSTHYDQ